MLNPESSPSPAPPVVEFEHVGLRYGVGPEVLRDVSFALPGGSFHFMTGPSGAGKSSLLSVLYLARQPSRGRVSLFGQDVVKASRGALAGLLASGVDFINLRYQVVVIPALSILLASRLMALPAALLELGLRRQARLMTGALVVTLGVCFALVAALSGVSWSLMAFVTGTLAWVIWAWHVIPRCGSQSVGLCGAISMMLLLPCGYFGMEAACPPTIEEQVDRKFSAKSLEHQTLWVVGEPVYASRLRVVSSGKLSVKFLPGNDLAPIAADTEASLILFAARTWPTDISRQFEVIQVLPILDVTFPQLFRATFRGDLPEYLGQSQRWAYLAVRRVNGNR